MLLRSDQRSVKNVRYSNQQVAHETPTYEYLPDCTALHPSHKQSWTSPPWEHQMTVCQITLRVTADYESFLNSISAVHILHQNPVSILKFICWRHFYIFRLGLESSLFIWVYLDFSVIQKYCIVWITYFTFLIKSVWYFIPEGWHRE